MKLRTNKLIRAPTNCPSRAPIKIATTNAPTTVPTTTTMTKTIMTAPTIKLILAQNESVSRLYACGLLIFI